MGKHAEKQSDNSGRKTITGYIKEGWKKGQNFRFVPTTFKGLDIDVLIPGCVIAASDWDLIDFDTGVQVTLDCTVHKPPKAERKNNTKYEIWAEAITDLVPPLPPENGFGVMQKFVPATNDANGFCTHAYATVNLAGELGGAIAIIPEHLYFGTYRGEARPKPGTAVRVTVIRRSDAYHVQDFSWGAEVDRVYDALYGVDVNDF